MDVCFVMQILNLSFSGQSVTIRSDVFYGIERFDVDAIGDHIVSLCLPHLAEEKIVLDALVAVFPMCLL